VQDANYNVTALFDNSGNVVERYVYDPFGQVTVLDANWTERSSGSQFAWQYLHQGGRFDSVSGLYHFRHRDYSPTQGRWTSLDPIRYEAGDVNLYRVVFNAPTVFTDPSGLENFENRIARQELKQKQRLAELERQQRLWNEMRERMKEITHKLKLPEAERQAIMDDLERLIDIARNEPHPGQLSGNCYTWVDCVMKKYRVNPKTYKWIKVGSQAWEYYIGIPFTKHWFGHIAIKIELPDGSIYYLDDGWCGRIFKPDDIPWYVHEYPRPDRSGKRLGPECFYDLNYRKGPH
jgi:RHS repeat-associated protein